MIPKSRELIDAREATAALLEQLNLKAYLFEVEADEDAWIVRVEWDRDGEWQTLAMPVQWDQLLDSRSDSDTRETLLKQWRSQFVN